MKEFVQFTWEKTNEFYYPNVDHDDDGDDSDAGHSVRCRETGNGSSE